MNFDDMARLLGMIPSIADRLDRIDERLDRLTPPQFVSVDEAARRLGCSTQTVAAMVKRGELAHRRAGRRLLIDATALRPIDPARIATLARAARAGT